MFGQAEVLWKLCRPLELKLMIKISELSNLCM